MGRVLTDRKGWKADIARTPTVDQTAEMRGRFLIGLLAIVLTGCSGQTYSAETMCGGRLPNWLGPSTGIGDLRPLQPVIITQGNSIDWNGKEISDATLDRYLSSIHNLYVQPQVVLRVEDGADCNVVRRTREKIDSILECQKYHDCGEGTGWRRWPGARPEA